MRNLLFETLSAWLMFDPTRAPLPHIAQLLAINLLSLYYIKMTVKVNDTMHGIPWWP
jgi:hypothetical protein